MVNIGVKASVKDEQVESSHNQIGFISSMQALEIRKTVNVHLDECGKINERKRICVCGL